VKKYLRIILAFSLSSSTAFGDGANNTVRNEAANLMKEAGTMAVAAGAYKKIGDGCGAATGGTCKIIFYGLAVAALGAALERRGQSRNTKPDDIECPTCNSYPTPPPPPDFGGPTPDPTITGGPGGNPIKNKPDGNWRDPLVDLGKQVDNDINKVTNDLNSAGIPTDPDSLKKAAHSGAGLSGDSASKAMAALSPEMKAMFENEMKNAAAKYNVASVELDGGGGAGGRGFGGHGGKDSNDKFDLSAFLPKNDADRDPASPQGLSKSFNGDPIGVAQADIFKQVHDRYLAKQKTGMFIKAASPNRK